MWWMERSFGGAVSRQGEGVPLRWVMWGRAACADRR